MHEELIKIELMDSLPFDDTRRNLTPDMLEMHMLGSFFTPDEIKLAEEKTKRDVLALYASSVYTGNRNYGVKAALREYFGVEDISEAGFAESSFVVSLFPSPNNSIRPFMQGMLYARDTLENLVDQELVSAEEYESFKRQSLYLRHIC